jgi:WD40-like Beta Propeller Repeat
VEHRRRTVLLLCGLVLLAGGFASSCSSRTHRGAGGAPTGTTETSRTLPPLGQRLSRQRIVFDDEFAGKGASQGFGGIDSIRLDGRGLRRLATGASDPAVSPDRTRIAYWGEPSGGGGGIFVMRADGTHRRWIDHERLINVAGCCSPSSTLDGQPAWSPDGRTLVFVTLMPRPSGGPEQVILYTINADGSGRRRLARSAVSFPGPTWINDREILILLSEKPGELAIISAKTGRIERVIAVPARGTRLGPERPALAPNRREIAYVECDSANCSSASVDLITLRGRLLRRIRGAHTPAWSPRGDLLYACCQQAGIRGNKSRIMFASANGGPARAITPSSLSADQPQWLGLTQGRRPS